MSNLINDIQNNVLASLSSQAPRHVVSAIKQASAETGVNFAYLVKQAAAESSFNPEAKAKTSSAQGLYQFIESTWMSMVEKHGVRHGIETEGKSRAEILEMRNDPRTASIMAAEFASENEKFLRNHYGGKIGATELYFAHFLGAGQAAAFLNAKAENPMQQAAVLFPAAAKANHNVFYEPATGRARSLDGVYAFFDGKFSTHQTTSAPKAKDVDTTSSNLDYVRLIERNTNSMNGFTGHHNLFTNPIEIMLMTQMDLPISRKNPEFQLFSAYTALK